MKAFKIITLVFSICFINTAIFAQKTLIESFNYPIGSLDAKGTATDGWKGAWLKSAGGGQVVEGNFGSDTGKKLKTWFNPDEDFGTWIKFTRDLTERWRDNGQAIWISFYMKCTYGETPRFAQIALVDLNDGGTEISPPFIIGVSGTTKGKIGINASAKSEVSDKDLTYILAKIECDGVEDRENNGDKVYFWVNYFNPTEPVTSTAVASLATSFAGFDQLRITSHKEYSTEWDKIRISNTFAPEVISGISTSITNSFEIQLLPNSNQLKLSVYAEEVILMNLQGKELLKAKGDLVDVSMLSKGLYIVKATYQGESTVTKVLKN